MSSNLLYPSFRHRIPLRMIRNHYLSRYFNAAAMFDENWDPPSLLRILGTPKILTHDDKAFSKSNVDLAFAGYRPTNFDKLSTIWMIYRILYSSSGNWPRASIGNSWRSVTLYIQMVGRKRTGKSSQSAGLCHLIIWHLIMHSEINVFKSSFIPTKLCPQLLYMSDLSLDAPPLHFLKIHLLFFLQSDFEFVILDP